MLHNICISAVALSPVARGPLVIFTDGDPGDLFLSEGPLVYIHLQTTCSRNH